MALLLCVTALLKQRAGTNDLLKTKHSLLSSIPACTIPAYATILDRASMLCLPGMAAFWPHFLGLQVLLFLPCRPSYLTTIPCETWTVLFWHLGGIVFSILWRAVFSGGRKAEGRGRAGGRRVCAFITTCFFP